MAKSSFFPALAFIFATACAEAPPPPQATVPPQPPPVSCWENPVQGSVAVTCRFFADAQLQEVWQRGVDRASLIAVSLGYTHIQWLSSDPRPETVRYTTPVDCWRGWNATVRCAGGNPVDQTVAWLMTTRFVFLSASDASARANDPLVPRERRPIDARERAAPHAAATTPAGRPPAGGTPSAAGWNPE